MLKTHPPMPFEQWLRPDAAGLYCVPGGFHIDPHAPVARAVITHGHSDHARPGHSAALATPETVAIIARRLGSGAAGSFDPLPLGEPRTIGDVTVTLKPAGHVLGSAQVVLDYQGRRAVVSGDYKREPDPTCAPFEVVPCDLFVTEATFGLPVFRHEPAAREIDKVLAARQRTPERSILIGAYGLGKAQRLIGLLRQAGYERPIWIHGAIASMCEVYEQFGVALGELRNVADAPDKLAGEIVIAPPGQLTGAWARRLADPLIAYASGWMRVRGRARQRGVELPLVISDHVDWPAIVRTITETGAGEIWITHGREDALLHQVARMGLKGRALALIGREDETE